MASYVDIKHPLDKCQNTAFYVPAFPVGRGVEPFDALNEYGFPIAVGNRVECVSCGERVDFDSINSYYEVEP